MRREVERKSTLPPYSISTRELQTLFDRLSLLFQSPAKLSCSIGISLKSEKLDFDNVRELAAYKELRGNVTNFRIRLSGGGRTLWIGSFGLVSYVSAVGEDEGWCAGAVETVRSFVASRKLPYDRFIFSSPRTYAVVLMLFAFLSYISIHYFTNRLELSQLSLIALSFCTFVLGILAYVRFVTPGAIIRVTEEQSFIRRYKVEIQILSAIIIPLLIAVVGWLAKK